MAGAPRVARAAFSLAGGEGGAARETDCKAGGLVFMTTRCVTSLLNAHKTAPLYF